MKTTKLFIAIILFAISAKAQTNTEYYDEYGRKIGSSKSSTRRTSSSTIVQPISTYAPAPLQYIDEAGAALQAKTDRNAKYFNDLIDWIFSLKNKCDEQEFLDGLNKNYEKLMKYSKQDITWLDNELREVNRGIQEEIDKYNNRVKELPKKYFDNATKNYSVSNYSQAISDYTKCLELNPDNQAVYFNRGLAYYQNSTFSLALKDFDKSIEINPYNAQNYAARANTKYSLNDFGGALIDYNKELELDVNSYGGFSGRANVKAELKDYFGAVSDWKRALAINSSNPDGYNGIAWTFFLQKDYKSALQYINKAIVLNPFYGIRYDAVHCLPLKIFPVMIHYTIDENKKIIIVRSVINTSKDPKTYWVK